MTESEWEKERETERESQSERERERETEQQAGRQAVWCGQSHNMCAGHRAPSCKSSLATARTMSAFCFIANGSYLCFPTWEPGAAGQGNHSQLIQPQLPAAVFWQKRGGWTVTQEGQHQK